MTDVVECAPGFRADQLEGFRIGVTSDRRSADLIDALARRGAQVLHAPTLRMANAVSDDPVIAMRSVGACSTWAPRRASASMRSAERRSLVTPMRKPSSWSGRKPGAHSMTSVMRRPPRIRWRVP